MIYFSFVNLAFNSKSSESTINIVISSKSRYGAPGIFAEAAIGFLDEKIYPGDGIKDDYPGMKLRAGLYENIVREWISSLDKIVDIQADNIIRTFRIVTDQFDPMRDEYILETEDEYIMFLWCTSA